MYDKIDAIKIVEILKEYYPDAKCSLDFKNPFELVVAAMENAIDNGAKLNLLEEVISIKKVGTNHSSNNLSMLRGNYLYTVEMDKLNASSSFLPQIILSTERDQELIRNSDGNYVMTLNLNEDNLRNQIKVLKSYGLDGIECYHSKQTLEEAFRENISTGEMEM